jgi:hypothetical protein
LAALVGIGPKAAISDPGRSELPSMIAASKRRAGAWPREQKAMKKGGKPAGVEGAGHGREASKRCGDEDGHALASEDKESHGRAEEEGGW